MSCRNSASTSAITTVIHLCTGLQDPQVLSLFHEERKNAKNVEGLEEQMTDARMRLNKVQIERVIIGLAQEGRIKQERVDELAKRLDGWHKGKVGEPPHREEPTRDLRLRYAQCTALDRAQRARAEINRAIRDAAQATGRDFGVVNGEFWTTWKNAYKTKQKVEDEAALIARYPHASHDAATLVALAGLTRPAPARALRVPQFTVRAKGVSAMPGYPATLQALVGREVTTGRKPQLKLMREPENPHDPSAVAILNDQGARIAYLPRDLAERVAPAMDSGTVYEVANWRVVVDPDHENRPGLEVEVKQRTHRSAPVPAERQPTPATPPAVSDSDSHATESAHFGQASPVGDVRRSSSSQQDSESGSNSRPTRSPNVGTEHAPAPRQTPSDSDRRFSARR